VPAAGYLHTSGPEPILKRHGRPLAAPFLSGSRWLPVDWSSSSPGRPLQRRVVDGIRADL
jgi:hypothetical protein